jgi:hypothetical protein
MAFSDLFSHMEERLMSRKLVAILTLLLLVGVLSGVSYANVVPTQITFGPNITGSVTVGAHAAVFATGPNNTGFTGLAWQASQPQGSFSLSGATLNYATGNNPYTFGVNSQTFTVTIGSNTMTGSLDLQALFVGGPYGFFAGTFDITSSSWGFVQTGFPVGALVDIDFVTYNHQLSSGEINPVPTPEPGTIALVGTGLLGLAGFLRRRA